MSKSKNSGPAKTIWFTVISLVAFSVLIGFMTVGRDIALLNPKGTIADQQRTLLLVTTGIMLVFAAIIIACLYFFTWRYREDNHKPGYTPNENAGRSKWLIALAWISPIIVFIILTAIMLPATQKLEPQKSIASDNEEMTIRVIALRWKWLFMYPEEDIATVNYVQIPVDTPVRFELTADEAPMQSFWIPHLGGMLYSMTEHVNPLNLMAHTIGDYDGGAAEINGHGFAGMRFNTRVSSREDFDAWAVEAAQSSKVLDEAEYARLLEPTEYNEPAIYRSPANQALFSSLLQKYAGSHNHGGSTEGYENGGHH